MGPRICHLSYARRGAWYRGGLRTRVFEQVLLGVAEATDLPDLAARVVPAVGTLLGASWAILHREHADGVEGGPLPAWADAMRLYGPYEPTCPLRALKLQLNPRVAVTTDLLDARARRSSPVFAECFARIDAERQLVARIGAAPFGRAGATALILTRSRRQRAFTGGDLRTVELFVPALAAALARSDRWQAVEAATADLPQLAIGADGRVLWIARAAETLLGGHVPAPLLAHARRLARAAHAGPLAVRFGTRAHETALLRRITTGVPCVLVLLDGAQPLAPHDAAVRFGLTRAETAVLDAALARGYSNPEIAAHLRIARGTVRIHLSRVYAKLGIRSRAQALVRVRR